MKHRRRLSPILPVALIVLVSLPAAAGTGGPESLAKWHTLWTRQPKVGSAALDADQHPPTVGAPSIRVAHRGQKDWSLTSTARLNVRAGDVVELAAWVKVRGRGEGQISVVTYDAAGKVVQWMAGLQTVRQGNRWLRVRSRVIVPPGVASLVPRLTGAGPATVWMRDFTWTRTGNVLARADKGLPKHATVANETLSVTFNTAEATLAVRDLRTGHTWRQKAAAKAWVLKCSKAAGSITANMLDSATGLNVTMTLRLGAGKSAEMTLSVSADGPMGRPMTLPNPFEGRKGTTLVIQMNEGISYPADDATIRPRRLIAYGGHGICMGFWGITDGSAGHMAIIETPDDAAIDIRRSDGLLHVAPLWVAQKGRFGTERRLRYVFFDRGGHVAMCKRYRAYARKIGRLKTLAAKRKDVPAVDRLIGAVNVWCWDRDATAIVKEMQAEGIERILWSNRRDPKTIRAMNDMPGVLTSRYDIFQDVMNPAQFKHLRGVHPDWPAEAWPKDLMIRADGDWQKGWAVRGKDGKMYPCGVLCDRQAPAYAVKRLAAELKTHPYRCRFIDTTTASSWRECYHPDHPMTRTDSRLWKMKLLQVISDKFKLVTGSETGHDAAVPYVHYFEGMLSLGPYRVPDAGRNMIRIWDDVPPRVATFQLGHRYRLPLWELVYHDCAVAQWYWGDYNNKLPALWDKRDLFNILYGTPPMFMFTRSTWRANKARFAQSYKRVCPVVRSVGYAEMTDHRFLTTNRDVQQTTFANGVRVTVNFGDTPYAKGGLTVRPRSYHVRTK